MIYELNGTVHWELSPELMRDLIDIVRAHVNVTPGAKIGDARLIELSNFASALECELYRMRDNLETVQPDNLDLMAALKASMKIEADRRDARVYKAEGFPVDESGGLEL